MKKGLKVSEKAEKIKKIFSKMEVELTEEQIGLFLSQFELQKKEAIEEAIKPVQAKLDEYTKRNYTLAGALEEAKEFKDNFEKAIETKIKQIEAIKIPDIPKIEESLNKLMKEKMDLLEKKIAKLDEAANKINEKILPLKLDEDIKKINNVGNVFANYKDLLAKALVEIESSEIKTLKEKLIVADKKASDTEKKCIKLEEQILQERTNTEITLLLENSSLDRDEKEHLYKYYEKTGYEEGKNEIQKFITIKESKEREKPVQRSFVRENVGGVKPMNDVGVLQKKRLLGESSSFARDIDEWANLARIEESEQI
jgi:hypothetical protein